MKHKSSKSPKRTNSAANARRPGVVRTVRAVRGDDLGDRRLQLLLGTKPPAR